MGERQETADDIIAEMRIFKCRNLETGELELCNAIANYLAGRLEAAWKREKAAIEADALAVGGIVGESHKREMSKNASKNGADFGQLGDCAKLREALKCIDSIAKYLEAGTIRDVQHAYRNIQDRVRIALAAPPRNCDRFGGDNAKLQKVYYSECGKEYEPQDPNSRQAYLVGYGNWLLALAQEGGVK